MTVSLCALERQHVAALARVEALCQPYPWGARRFDEEFDCSDAIVVGAVDDSVLVGFLVLRFVADELWIFNIGTDPRRRRQGIGDRLMERATSTAKAMGVPLWLEVRERNAAAVKLYEKHGLVVVGRRPKYYPPLQGEALREAALQMRTFTGGAGDVVTRSV